MGKAIEEVMRSAQELLAWSQAHPSSTPRELEEKVKAWKAEAATKVLEAAVALQGAQEEEHCSCGGRWAFPSFKGVIRVKRAYFTCERCGAGIFPM